MYKINITFLNQYCKILINYNIQMTSLPGKCHHFYKNIKTIYTEYPCPMNNTTKDS